MPEIQGKFRRHRYTVSLVLVPSGAGEADAVLLDRAVTELRIYKDYDNHVFPYLRLELGVSTAQARTIQAEWRTARLYLGVKKWYVSDGAADSGELVDAFDDYLKNAEFQIMTLEGGLPRTPFYQENDIPEDLPATIMTMEIAPTIALSINKRINNGVYHATTLGEVVMHLTADNKPEAKRYPFFFAPPDNPKKYENVLVPPLTYVRALRYLDEVHGLYAGTLSVFLDTSAGYVLSSAKKITPDSGIKSVVLELMSADEAGPGDVFGSASDEGGTARLRTGQRIAMSADGPARKETIGEAVKLVEANHREKSGSDCRSLVPDGVLSSKTPKERVAWQAYDNPMTAEKLRVAAREAYAPATVRFDGVDLAAFAPGLEWSVITADPTLTPLTGAWRVKAVEIVLQSSAGSDESAEPHVSATIVPTALAKDSAGKTAAPQGLPPGSPMNVAAAPALRTETAPPATAAEAAYNSGGGAPPRQPSAQSGPTATAVSPVALAAAGPSPATSLSQAGAEDEQKYKEMALADTWNRKSRAEAEIGEISQDSQRLQDKLAVERSPIVRAELRGLLRENEERTATLQSAVTAYDQFIESV